MNRKSRLLFVFVMVIISAGFIYSQTSTEPAQENAAGFKINKLAVGTGVESRELVGEAQTFPVATEKVFCLLDAAGIASDTQVNFVWFLNDKELNRTSQTLKQGARWRTWVTKNLYQKTGNWKVELQDSTGAVIGTAEFKVE